MQSQNYDSSLFSVPVGHWRLGHNVSSESEREAKRSSSGTGRCSRSSSIVASVPKTERDTVISIHNFQIPSIAYLLFVTYRIVDHFFARGNRRLPPGYQRKYISDLWEVLEQIANTKTLIKSVLRRAEKVRKEITVGFSRVYLSVELVIIINTIVFHHGCGKNVPGFRGVRE